MICVQNWCTKNELKYLWINTRKFILVKKTLGVEHKKSSLGIINFIELILVFPTKAFVANTANFV